MRKLSKILTVTVLATTLVLTSFGCGKTVDNSKESKTCIVNALISGYDTDWLKANITAFNQIYKAEGYEVKLELEDTNINSSNTVKSVKRNDVDLYFDNNGVNTIVESSRSILRDNTSCLLEDLTDVLDSLPINANKQNEGSKTIRQKLAKNTAILNQCKYTGLSASQSVYSGTYAIPYASSTTGIYVNKNALTTLGYTMDDLLTTDAMLDMCDEIVKDYNISSLDYNSKFFPIAYASSNAGGYVGYMFDYWLAQYEGVENYNNFWEFIPSEGTTLANGYDVYKDYGLLETLRCISEITNSDLIQPGASSTLHTAAQGRVFVGTSNSNYEYGSLLMVSGDWIYKESSKDYGEYLNDVVAIKAPVISSVGMKLGLCGQSHAEKVDGYGTRHEEHCAECEAKLKAIVKAVDENTTAQKSNAQIASEVGVAEAQVEYIRNIRGIIINGEGINVAFIPSYSNAKTVAKLFLRYLFSNQGQKTFEEKTYVTSLYDLGGNTDTASMNARELAMYNKTNSYNTINVFPNKTNKLRKAMSSYFPATSTNVGVYLSLGYSHKYGENKHVPETIYKNNIEYVKLSWYDYLLAAGLQ